MSTPQDIPFYPDWMHREIGAETRWCVAPRLTDQLRAKGYTRAITARDHSSMEIRHAKEVRAAVRARLIEITGSPDLVAAMLADPAIAILTDKFDRQREVLSRSAAAPAR